MENHADMWSITRAKLNMLHVAAQSDQVVSLFYFRQKGLDLDSVDEQGNTSLHWALHERSEIALSYILAWKPNIDIRDFSGFTPLHIAVKSVEEMETIRLVRFMTLKGADRSIRDNNGLRPIDMVDSNLKTTNSIKRDLKKLLGPPGTFDFMQL